MGAFEVEAFLNHLAVNRNVSALTQNLALSALLFIYREVQKIALPWLDGVSRRNSRSRTGEQAPGYFPHTLSSDSGDRNSFKYLQQPPTGRSHHSLEHFSPNLLAIRLLGGFRSPDSPHLASPE